MNEHADQSRRWKWPLLIAAACLLGAILIGGLIWVALDRPSESGTDGHPDLASGSPNVDNSPHLGSGPPGGGGPLDLAYLPPDAELIISCRVSEIWNAPILAPLVNNPKVQEQVGEVRNRLGFALADVQSATIAIPDLAELWERGRRQAEAAQAGGGVAPPGTFDATSGVMVIRTSAPIDGQKLIAFARQSAKVPLGELEEVSHDGEEYWRVATPENSESPYIAAFFPNDETIVFGPEEEVKKAITQGADGQPRPELDFVDLDQHLVFAVVPKDSSVLAQQPWNPPETAPESVVKLKEAFNGTVKGGSFGLTFNEGIDFQVQWDGVDEAAAEQIAALMRDVVADFHAQFDEKIAEAAVTAPTPLLAELVEVGKQVVDSVKVGRCGTTVALKAALPGSARETFSKIPDAIASAFQPPKLAAGAGAEGMDGYAADSPFFAQEPEQPRPLESVSLEAFNAGWQVELDVRDRPAGELLKELAEQLEMKLKPLPGQETALNQPVSLNVRGISRLQAIDGVCQQIGLFPNFPESAPDTMTLKKGPRPWPTIFVGPFQIEVTELKENVPDATGRLQLRALAAGLPESLAYRWHENDEELLTITQIVDARGQRLLQGIGGSAFALRQPPSVYRQTMDIGLKNLLKHVDTIKILKGNVRLSIPTKVEILKFDQLTKGETRAAGDIHVTLTQIGLGGQTHCEFQFEGTERQNVEIAAYDADDQPLDTMGSGWSGSRGKMSADLWLEGEPKSVEVRIITDVVEGVREFSLPEIALPSHDQMPDKLVPVQFAGLEPVTCKFVRFAGDENFRKIVFQVTNHTNKDIKTLTLDMSYADGAGTTLKESPHTQGFTGNPLEKNSNREVGLPAFFMPDGTETVSARATLVNFADASVWDRADVLTDEEVPYVIGTVALSLTRADDLSAGYVGLDTGGRPVSNMAGVLDISAASSRKWTSSLTHKPRVTNVRLQDGATCKISHVRLIPGRYLLYVRRGERNCDWQWITVDDQSKHDVAFAIDDEQTATLKVLLPSTTQVKEVELIPLDEAGTVPIADRELAKLRIGYWLGTSLQPESGEVVFEGLSAGKYRVLAGALSRDVEVLADRNVSISLP